MKPSTSAFIGAVLVSGGWISVPTVALAAHERVSIIAPADREGAASAAKRAHEEAGTCRTHGHAHASSCTCASCTSARAE